MIFIKEKKAKTSLKNKVLFIFFQTPSAIVLSKINNYLTQNNHCSSGYLGNQPVMGNFQHLGELSMLPYYLTNFSPDEIIIIGDPKKGEVSQEMLLALKLSGAIIKLIPIAFDLLTGLITMRKSRDIPHIRLYPDSVNILDRTLKWVTNKFIAIAGILLTTLAFPLIALFIKATSKGPVFYHQKRLGKNAKPFILYKFRTMHASAEKDGPQLTQITDKRITKAGQILRYWHIDELPQFWNILKGDMALIGPRPERPFFAKFLTKEVPYYKIIYQEKPGLTSLGMIKYGYASSIEDMKDRLYYDVLYLNNPSFLMDLKILGNTIWYVILKTFYDPSIERRKLRKEQLSALMGADDPLIRWLSLKDSAQ